MSKDDELNLGEALGFGDHSTPDSDDLARAERDGRDQAENGDDEPTHGITESQEEKNARERGFNEQRTADAAAKKDEDE